MRISLCSGHYWTKYFTKNLRTNKKLVLEHQEKISSDVLKEEKAWSIFNDFSKTHGKNLKEFASFLKLRFISIQAIRSQR